MKNNTAAKLDAMLPASEPAFALFARIRAGSDAADKGMCCQALISPYSPQTPGAFRNLA